MSTAKAMSDTTKSTKNLQDAITRLGNATGAKEVAQAHGQINALGVAEQIKGNTLLTGVITTLSSAAELQVQQQAAAMGANQESANGLATAVAASVATAATKPPTIDYSSDYPILNQYFTPSNKNIYQVQ